MSSREEFEACLCDSEVGPQVDHMWMIYNSETNTYGLDKIHHDWVTWQASRAHESELLSALKAITNSGPDAIPIKEAFEMAYRAIERATGDKV